MTPDRADTRHNTRVTAVAPTRSAQGEISEERVFDWTRKSLDNRPTGSAETYTGYQILIPMQVAKCVLGSGPNGGRFGGMEVTGRQTFAAATRRHGRAAGR